MANVEITKKCTETLLSWTALFNKCFVFFSLENLDFYLNLKSIFCLYRILEVGWLYKDLNHLFGVVTGEDLNT